MPKEIKVNIGIDLAAGPDSTAVNCPMCFGTGKLKAMQNAMTYDGPSVRVEDKTIKCMHCMGTRSRVI